MSGPLGIFGGSFDPPHTGHVLAACYALCTGQIEELWVVPAYGHPFGKPLSGFEARLRMCELAVADLRRCHVSDLERERGGTSYTVDLLEAVAARQPGRPLRLVLGTDVLGATHRWRSFDRIRELAPPLYIHRGGHPHPDLDTSPRIPAVSSSELRRRLGEGLDVDGLLPAPVARYARAERLYQGEP